MEEEEKKEAYDNVDILFEDDHVIFVKIYSLTAAKYFGPEYLSRRFNYFSKGDVYVIYDKDENEHYVLHKPTQYDVNILDYNQDDVSLNDLEKKYPYLEGKITEIVGKSLIYSALIQIKNGVELDEYELSRLDNLIGGFRFNKNNPGNSKITIKFDDTEDYLKLFDIDEYDIRFIESLVGSGYYGSDEQFYSYDMSNEDWKQGYLLRDFNEKNLAKVKEIIQMLSPELLNKTDDDYYEGVSKLLMDNFEGEIDYITSKYAQLRNDCSAETARNEIVGELENPFMNFGIFEVSQFYKYVTTINVLLGLFNMSGKKNGGIRDVFEYLGKDKNFGPYEEYRFEYGCDDFDNESFQNEVERNLDKISEKLEDSNIFVDIDEYRKILNTITPKYEFRRSYPLPKDKTKTFSIISIDPKTNKILVQYNNYKGLQGKQERRNLSLEEFNNFLYHPELFESKINKKVITESKIQKVALKWMNDNFSPDKLEIVKSPKYPNSIFYIKNGQVVMEQDLKNKNFYFHYDEIWSFFESFFGIEYSEIQQLMEVWLEETLNLEGYTPNFKEWAELYKLEETLNLEGYTPHQVTGSDDKSWKSPLI